MFLHRLQRGAASRSYGIACARLAGIPEPVLGRARALLAELERSSGGRPSGIAQAGRAQLGLFEEQAGGEIPRSPVLETLCEVDVNRLTPLEALQLVASLQKLANRA